MTQREHLREGFGAIPIKLEISPSTMFIKTKIVLNDVLVPLHHETSASVPSYVVALITTSPQLSWTAVIIITIIAILIMVIIIIIIIITIIILIIIITQPGLLSNRKPALGES